MEQELFFYKKMHASINEIKSAISYLEKRNIQACKERVSKQMKKELAFRKRKDIKALFLSRECCKCPVTAEILL